MLALGVLVALLASVSSASAGTKKRTPKLSPPGGPLSRKNVTPLPSSRFITGAQWLTGRYDPPANQWGDILPTVWSDDGSTYLLMDDGGTDVPEAGGLWRQSFAKVTGNPPNLRFHHVGDPTAPAPHTWAQIGGNPNNDDGPLGPYYSIGFAEAGGVFYATQEQNWDWSTNGPFTGLAGIAYSTDHGKTWQFPLNAFPAPLGNLTFVDGGGPGGSYPDGYMYAIGTEREFNASHLILGRVQTGIANVTDPSRWQWFTGRGAGGTANWSSSLAAGAPVLSWSNHITYPQMTYDPGLHRYLLTFTYSYSSSLPAVWKGGAELVIAESAKPWGPFSFVAASRDFGPSNGYSAGFPSHWISQDGRTLWLKWAANFDGCAKGLDCSGAYGFNYAQIRLTTKPAAATTTKPAAPTTTEPAAPTTTKPAASTKAQAPAKSTSAQAKPRTRKLLYVVSGLSLPLLLFLLVDRRRPALRRRRRS